MACPMWIVLPVPPVIQVKVTDTPKEDRKRLDNYVKDFVVRHGYKITISHSSNDNGGLCHYDCHRGGHPARPKPKKINGDAPPCSTNPKKPHVTRSIKIQCPFRLTGKLDKTTNTWELHHVRIGHNHGPADTEAKQMSVAVPIVPNIVYTQEIDSRAKIESRATRILQLSPRRQDIILQELDKLINQHSTIHSVTSPPKVNEADSNEDEVISFEEDIEEDIPVNPAHLSQEQVFDQTAPQYKGILTKQLNEPIWNRFEVDVNQAQEDKDMLDEPHRFVKEFLPQVDKDKPNESPVGQVETDASKGEEPIKHFKNKRTKRVSSRTTNEERPPRKNKKVVKSKESQPQACTIPVPRTTRSGAQTVIPTARSSRHTTKYKKYLSTSLMIAILRASANNLKMVLKSLSSKQK
ncbi:uncharacterized protein MELLADRAFT_113392 [Melampsora larici-populina 98AG31]|uniref:Uncharacterized protein n=1 Tax=Melampsora larici-populina (strain 98AG31 / pathotype 3-4-7) TaxID=747676 RepID=F4S9Q1_MELLP|nr:uncharacterized protein MELLADRAFT_113392 [Melampsora larici-populina 98AG31]EGF98629.1 hypothetical protein MELLADRAFT_113392 [Melampsora larici-populina 98AG31]